MLEGAAEWVLEGGASGTVERVLAAVAHRVLAVELARRLCELAAEESETLLLIQGCVASS